MERYYFKFQIDKKAHYCYMYFENKEIFNRFLQDRSAITEITEEEYQQKRKEKT